MKKILFILSMLWGVVHGQTPAGYTNINARYDWLAGKFRALTLPSGNDTALQAGQTRQAGAIWVDTVGASAGIYFWMNNKWNKVGAGNAIDSIYRRSDSVFITKNGAEQFAFTDSIGSAGGASSDSAQSAYGRLFNSLNIFGEDTLFVVGDSFSASYGVSGGEGWNAIFAARYGLVNLSYALSSSGIWNAAKEANNRFVTKDMTRSIAVMVGFNDLRRSIATSTYKKIGSGVRAIAANNLINVFTPASAATATSGTWTAQDMNAWGGKAGSLTAGTGLYSNTSGDYLEFNATGSAFIIGYASRVTSGFSGGVFTISVDGTTYATVTADQADGVSDGVNNNQIMPGAFFVKGLSNTVHNIRVTNVSNNYVYIDYFATAKTPSATSPIFISEIPKMPQSGYAIAPNAASDAAFNLADDTIANAVRMFEGWPITIVPVNSYYNIPSDAQADSIHPSRQGYRHIADAFSSSISKKDFPIAANDIANGGVTNSAQVFGGDKQFLKGLQLRGALAGPAVGGGLEMEYNSGTGYITSINRTGNAYQPLILRGSTTTFNSGGTNYAQMATSGIWTFERGMIINNGGAANNTQIKTDTDDNAIFANGTTNNIGIGTATPGAKLEVNGTLKINTVADVVVKDSALFIENGIVVKGAPASGGITDLAPEITIATSNFTITEPADHRQKTYVVSTLGSTVTVTAPASPTNGQIITLYMQTFSGGSVVYPTFAGTETLTSDGSFVTLQWSPDVAGYIVISKKTNNPTGPSVIAVSSSTTLTAPAYEYDIIEVNTSGGAVALTLPSMTAGKGFVIKKTDNSANAITFTTDEGVQSYTTQFSGAQIYRGASSYKIKAVF